MKKKQLKAIAASAILCAASTSFPSTSFAQAYATGPNGQVGYITTPNPISPNCTPPDVWTAYNGHYICAPPPPQCQYGYSSAPVLNGNGSWSYSCNGPPASPPVTSPTGGGGGSSGGGGGGSPSNGSLLASCESAIQLSVSHVAWAHSMIPFANGGWAVEGTYWSQPNAASVYLTNDTYFALYGTGGSDYVYTVFDDQSAGNMVWYQCVVSPTTGAVGSVTSGAASGPCSGCGGSN